MFVYFVVLYFVVLLTVVGANDIFSLTAEDLNGNSVSLAKYNSAKAVLIGIYDCLLENVNTVTRYFCIYCFVLHIISNFDVTVNVASNCGYTYTNYRELTDMYDRLHSKGLEILAFPCNQFGEQEPGTNEEIKLFVENYGVKFPVFSKVLIALCLTIFLSFNAFPSVD